MAFSLQTEQADCDVYIAPSDWSVPNPLDIQVFIDYKNGLIDKIRADPHRVVIHPLLIPVDFAYYSPFGHSICVNANWADFFVSLMTSNFVTETRIHSPRSVNRFTPSDFDYIATESHTHGLNSSGLFWATSQCIRFYLDLFEVETIYSFKISLFRQCATGRNYFTKIVVRPHLTFQNIVVTTHFYYKRGSFCISIWFRFPKGHTIIYDLYCDRPVHIPNFGPFIETCQAMCSESRFEQLLKAPPSELGMTLSELNVDVDGDCTICQRRVSRHHVLLATDQEYYLDRLAQCSFKTTRKTLSAAQSHHLRPDWIEEIQRAKDAARSRRCNTPRPRVADVDKINRKNQKQALARARKIKEDLFRVCGFKDFGIKQDQLNQITNTINRLTDTFGLIANKIDGPLDNLTLGAVSASTGFANLASTISSTATSIADTLSKAVPKLICALVVAVAAAAMIKMNYTKTAILTVVSGALYLLAPEISKEKYEELFDRATAFRKRFESTHQRPEFHTCGIDWNDISRNICMASIPFAGTIFAGLAALFFLGKMPDDKAWMGLYRKFDAIPKAVKGFETMAKYFEKGLDWLKKQYIKRFHPEVFNIKKTTSDMVTEFVDKINKYMDPVEFKRISKDEPTARACSTLFAEYTRLMKLGNELPKEAFSLLKELRVPMQKILDEVYKSNVFGNAYRIRPVTVHLMGPSAIGKTVLAYPLAIDILRAHGILTEEMVRKEGKNSYEKFIYSRNPTQEFWDGYDDQKHIVIYDDAFQARDSASNPNVELTEIIHLVNNFPLNLHMADIKDKSNTTFVGKGIILTSNDEQMKFESIVCNDAIYNRLDIPLRVFVKDEFCVEGPQGQKIQKLDLRKARRATGSTFNLDVYEFQRYKLSPDGHRPIGTRLSYSEVRALVYEECADRIEKFRGANQFLADYVEMPMPEGFEVRPDVEPEPDFINYAAHVTNARLGVDEPDFRVTMNSSSSCSHVSEGSIFGSQDPRSHNRVYASSRQSKPVPSVWEVRDHDGLRTIFFYEDQTYMMWNIEVSPFPPFELTEEMRVALFPPESILEKAGRWSRAIFPRWFSPAKGSDLNNANNWDYNIGFAPTKFISELYESGIVEEDTDEVFYEAGMSIEEFSQKAFKKRQRFSMMAAARHTCDRLKVTLSHLKDRFAQFMREHPLICVLTVAGGILAAIILLWGIFRTKKPRVVTTKMTACISLNNHNLLCSKFNACTPPDKVRVQRQFKIKTPPDDQKKVSRNFRVRSGDIVQVLQNGTHFEKDGRSFVRYEVDHDLVPLFEWLMQEYPDVDIAFESEEMKGLKFESIEKDEDGSLFYLFTSNEDEVKLIAMEPKICQSTNELALKVLANTYWMSYEHEGKEFFAGSVVGLKGSMIMMPYHYMVALQRRNFPDDKVITLRNETNKVGIQFYAKQFKNGHQVKCELGPKDAYIFDAGRNVPSFRNIVSNFINQRDMDKVVGSNCVFNYRPKTGNGFHDVHRQCEGPVYCQDITVAIGGEDYLFRKNYLVSTYSANEGDCGNVLVVDNKMLAGKYCGMLTAGSSNATAFSSLCREDLENTLKQFSKNVQIGWESSDLVEENFFTADNLHDVQHFIPIGTAKPVPVVTKNSIIKTPVYNKIYESNKSPAHLRPFVKDGVTIDPLAKSMEKIGFPSIEVNERALSMAAADVLALLKRTSKPNLDAKDYLKVLDWEETIKGRPGDEFLNAVARTTSPGYPYVFERPHDHPGKTYWFGKGDDYDIDRPQCKKLKADVDRKIECAKKGERTMSIYIDTLKMEKRKNSKNEKGETRLFSAAPLDLVCAIRKYYLGALAWIMHNHVDNQIAVGINPHSFMWNTLANKLQSKGPGVVAGDFTNYDGSLNAAILRKCNWIINELYDDGPENRLVRDVLFEDIVSSFHICEGKVYQWIKSLPSGVPLTAILNSIYNILTMRMVWHLQTGRTMMEFNRNCDMIAYGDDNVVNVATSVADIFNQEVMAEGYRKLGMIYTDEAKEGVSVKLRELKDILFLKRGFEFNSDMMRYVAPLDPGSIQEMLNWFNKCDNPNFALAANVNVAIMEWSKHGRETFDLEYKRIMDKLPDLTKMHLIVGHSYDDYLEYWLSNRPIEDGVGYWF